MLLALLAGCATTAESAEPTPTPAFSSEAEAFSAAEETYRAYVDALNRVDLSDPDTFEDVYAWTTGEANAGARETFSQMHADGWVISGETQIALIMPRSMQPDDFRDAVQLDVCLDVSLVALVDPAGASVVSPDRRDLQSMLVSMTVQPDSPTALLIANIDGREGEPLCAG